MRTRDPFASTGEGVVSRCHRCSPGCSRARARSTTEPYLQGRGSMASASISVPLRRRILAAAAAFAVGARGSIRRSRRRRGSTAPGSLWARLTRVLVPVLAVFRCAGDATPGIAASSRPRVLEDVVLPIRDRAVGTERVVRRIRGACEEVDDAAAATGAGHDAVTGVPTVEEESLRADRAEVGTAVRRE